MNTEKFAITSVVPLTQESREKHAHMQRVAPSVVGVRSALVVCLKCGETFKAFKAPELRNVVGGPRFECPSCHQDEQVPLAKLIP